MSLNSIGINHDDRNLVASANCNPSLREIWKFLVEYSCRDQQKKKSPTNINFRFLFD